MRIFTSSWFTPLPDTIQKIGISRGTPRGYKAGFRKMMKLAPGSYFKTASIPQYRQLFFEQLRLLDAHQVVEEIGKLSGGRDAALLCYEAPNDNQYCHRGYVSAWLADQVGIEVHEFGFEDRGHGWAHPKIPAQYRRGAQPEPLDVTPYLGSVAQGRDGRMWRVVGFDQEHPDQAVIEAGSDRVTISEDVLRSRFQPVI